jgi:tryptophan-rich sensory protein
MKKKKFNFKVFIVCLLVVFLIVGGIGSLFTSNNTNTSWYSSIKPSITPPNIVFPIVWNFLFLLISFSLYFAWTCSKGKSQKIKVAFLFGINFVLNILWSVLFFGLKLPKVAFIEVILLWLSILAVILGVNNISRKSSWLLLPYLVWVAFASILTALVAFF